MDTRIIHLLARKLSGEATPEELAELDLLLIHQPELTYHAEMLTQLWNEEKMRPAARTENPWKRHMSRHRHG